MKILGIGLPEPTVAAISQQKHLVIPCRVGEPEELFEYVDCEEPDIVAANADAEPWILSEIRRVRWLNVRTPVIALVSPNCASCRERRTDFLEAGGNDLFETPLEVRELIASMNALYRLYSRVSFSDVISVTFEENLVELYVLRKEIAINGVELQLSDMEYRVLELLLLKKGQLVTLLDINNALYGFLDLPDGNGIQVFINRIRKKLGPNCAELIQTVRRSGYRINC